MIDVLLVGLVAGYVLGFITPFLFHYKDEILDYLTIKRGRTQRN